VPKNERIDVNKEIEKLKSVCTLLQHESVSIDGITFFGTPHVWIGYDMAFTTSKFKKEDIWNKLPAKLDVLITHIPPFNIRDLHINKLHVGCKRLLASVQKIKPQVHIFGHIHESYGN
jgi:Icc-related predicted phosphoesterase